MRNIFIFISNVVSCPRYVQSLVFFFHLVSVLQSLRCNMSFTSKEFY
jgi:hypothetical protein